MDRLKRILMGVFDMFNESNMNSDDYDYHVLDDEIIWTIEGRAGRCDSGLNDCEAVVIIDDCIYVKGESSNMFLKLEPGGQKPVPAERVMALLAGDEE